MSDPDLRILTYHVHLFLDARGVAQHFRQAAIFGALDALHPGKSMRFSNNYDPLPLYSISCGSAMVGPWTFVTRSAGRNLSSLDSRADDRARSRGDLAP